MAVALNTKCFKVPHADGVLRYLRLPEEVGEGYGGTAVAPRYCDKEDPRFTEPAQELIPSGVVSFASPAPALAPVPVAAPPAVTGSRPFLPTGVVSVLAPVLAAAKEFFAPPAVRGTRPLPAAPPEPELVATGVVSFAPPPAVQAPPPYVSTPALVVPPPAFEPVPVAYVAPTASPVPYVSTPAVVETRPPLEGVRGTATTDPLDLEWLRRLALDPNAPRPTELPVVENRPRRAEAGVPRCYRVPHSDGTPRYQLGDQGDDYWAQYGGVPVGEHFCYGTTPDPEPTPPPVVTPPTPPAPPTIIDTVVDTVLAPILDLFTPATPVAEGPPRLDAVIHTAAENAPEAMHTEAKPDCSCHDPKIPWLWILLAALAGYVLAKKGKG